MQVETQDQETLESNPEVSTPEVEQTQKPPSEPVQETTPKEGEPKTLPPGEEPKLTYKPRDKFKVMDKEHDVPPWLKSTMTDEATEKQAIELLERSYGLDFVKPKLAETRKERDHFKGELSKRDHAIAEVRDAYRRGDIDGFLEKLQIPQERILQYALDKVNYAQLPEEQKRLLDETRQAQKQAYLLEKQNAQYQSQFYEQTVQAKQMMLDTSLSRPDIKTFADRFDSTVGTPGAFFEEVRALGESEWNRSGGKVDLTPDQAIEKVMSKWKNFVVQPAPAAQGAPQTAGPKVVQDNRPPSLPNIQGKSQSPLKSAPRSIEDLKKLAARMN